MNNNIKNINVGKKAGNKMNNTIPFDESMNYLVLLDLQSKLKRFDYNKLELKSLDVLRNEVNEKIINYQEKHKGKHF